MLKRLGFFAGGVVLGIVGFIWLTGDVSVLTNLTTWIGVFLVGLVSSLMGNFITAVFNKDTLPERDPADTPAVSSHATGIGNTSTAVGKQDIHGDHVSIFNAPVNLTPPATLPKARRDEVETLQTLFHSGTSASALCLAAHSVVKQLGWMDETRWLEYEIRGLRGIEGKNLAELLDGDTDDPALKRLLATRRVTGTSYVALPGHAPMELRLRYCVHEPIAELEETIRQHSGQQVEITAQMPVRNIPALAKVHKGSKDDKVSVNLPTSEYRSIPGRVKTQLLDLLLRIQTEVN